MTKTTLISFRKGGLFGLKDQEGHIIVPPTYTYIGDCTGDRIPVCIDDKVGYIDRTGRMVIPTKYTAAGIFTTPTDPDEPTLACVEQGNLCGFINQEGQEVIPLKYHAMYGYWQGLFAVETAQGVGVINAHGETVIPFEYQYIQLQTNGLIMAVKEKKVGFIDRNNQVVIPFKYQKIGGFEFGVCPVMLAGKCNCIDSTGKLLLDHWYKDVLLLDNGSFLLQDGSKDYTFAHSIDGPRETCIVEGNGVYSADGTTLLKLLGKQRSVVVRKGAVRLAYITSEDEDANRCQLTNTTRSITFSEGVIEIGAGWEDIQIDPENQGGSIVIFLPSTLQKVHPDAFRGMVDQDLIHSITFSPDSHLQIASILPPHLRSLVKEPSTLGPWFTKLQGHIMNEKFLNDPIASMSDALSKAFGVIGGVCVLFAFFMADGTFISKRLPFYTYLCLPLLAAAFTLLKLRKSRYVSSTTNFSKVKDETLWYLNGLWQWTLIHIIPIALLIGIVFGINRIGDGTPHNAKAVVTGVASIDPKTQREQFIITVPEKHVSFNRYANEVYAHLQVDRVVVVRYHTGLLGIDIIDDVR